MEYSFPVAGMQSMNGSSSTAHCSNVFSSCNGTSRCLDPTSSVLFDGRTPTLTGLDGDMWASQLLTIHSNPAVITFNFTETPGFVGVRRVEMVLFNCPKWAISVLSVQLYKSGLLAGVINPAVTSCDSLIRVCMPDLSGPLPELQLHFDLANSNDWLHIAEVAFYGEGAQCPPDTIITTPPSPTGITPH